MSTTVVANTPEFNIYANRETDFNGSNYQPVQNDIILPTVVCYFILSQM